MIKVLAAVAIALFFVVGIRRSETERENSTSLESPFGTTVKHDGHWLVVFKFNETVIHHPECPCHYEKKP